VESCEHRGTALLILEILKGESEKNWLVTRQLTAIATAATAS
jgi:hypothetical protein